MKSCIAVALCLLFGSAALTTSSAGEKTVELKDVKLADLKEVIKGQKGKIVVVDLWATNCIPCMREFPNLVELHKKHPKNLVCISVSLDKVKQKEGALKFLKKQNATLANYFLEDGYGEAGKEWDFNGIPVVVVYDAAGARARVFKNDDPDKQFDYKNDVIPFVDKLLKK